MAVGASPLRERGKIQQELGLEWTVRVGKRPGEGRSRFPRAKPPGRQASPAPDPGLQRHKNRGDSVLHLTWAPLAWAQSGMNVPGPLVLSGHTLPLPLPGGPGPPWLSRVGICVGPASVQSSACPPQTSYAAVLSLGYERKRGNRTGSENIPYGGAVSHRPH